MAHTEHAKKSHRQAEKARVANRDTRSALKTILKTARASVGQDAKATAAISSATAARLDKAAKHRVIHPNKASRLKSRLAKAMRKAAANPAPPASK